MFVKTVSQKCIMNKNNVTHHNNRSADDKRKTSNTATTAVSEGELSIILSETALR